MAIMLSATILLSGAGCTRNLPSYVGQVDNELIGDVKEDYTNEIERLSEDVLNEYLLYFAALEMTYNEDLYVPLKEVKKIIGASKTYKECVRNHDDDGLSLLKKIVDNSNKYVITNERYSKAFTSGKEGQKDEDRVILEALKIFLNKSTNDVREDICKMQDLSIVYDNMTTTCLDDFKTFKTFDKTGKIILAYYLPDENLIVMNHENITLIAGYSDVSEHQVMVEVLSHELNHVRQQTCSCRIRKGQEYKTLDYDDYVSFIMESSAESELYNLKGNALELKDNYQYCYEDERRYEARLLMLGLCHDGYEISDYYNAIYDVNLSDLHSFLGAKTEDDIHDLYNIIYSIDSILKRNDYVYKYYDKDVVTLSEAERAVGHDYVVNIFNKVLLNMINYTGNNKDFSLEENVVLFGVIKNIVVEALYDKITQENGNGSYAFEFLYNKDLTQKVFSSEKKYVEFLSEYYNLSINEIRDIEQELQKNFSCYEESAYEKIHKKLLIRFPLLSAIEVTNPVTGYEYDFFLEKNNLSLNYQR